MGGKYPCTIKQGTPLKTATALTPKHINLLNIIARLAAPSLGENLKDVFARINKTLPTITWHRYERMLANGNYGLAPSTVLMEKRQSPRLCAETSTDLIAHFLLMNLLVLLSHESPIGTGKVVWYIQCSLSKHEDLSSNPPNPHKANNAHICNPYGEMGNRTGASLGVCGPANLGAQQKNKHTKRSCLK